MQEIAFIFYARVYMRMGIMRVRIVWALDTPARDVLETVHLPSYIQKTISYTSIKQRVYGNKREIKNTALFTKKANALDGLTKSDKYVHRQSKVIAAL